MEWHYKIYVGEILCSCLPAVHHLTGADYTSKIGTKRNALLADPEKYLMTFAKGKTYFHFKIRNTLLIIIYEIYNIFIFSDVNTIEKSTELAEMYLIKVLSKNSQ